MKLYNSLSRKIEDFKPLHKEMVGIYLCGPTVYDNAHIGHMRKYVGDDVMVRSLRYLNYEPKVVMNITDVGHLVTDADEGEDKMMKGAKKYGMDVWGVAEMFTKQFFKSTDALNVIRPEIICKATDHIREQIEMIRKLEDKGLTYQIEDGIYFDTKAYQKQGGVYGELSSMEEIEEGARIGINVQKRDGHDFALWKFSSPNEQRQMEWESPWGVGFPGWHIECSAMSIKYLGEQFDIHTGGIDHKEVHHPNEIAQAEGATGKRPFVSYWMHHDFLKVDGVKMSKSLGNLYTIDDVIEKGIDPLALRYLFMQSHYRREMNFTWESLAAAETALHRLRRVVAKMMFQLEDEQMVISSEEAKRYQSKFSDLLSQDLAMPEIIALIWEMLKDYVLDELNKVALVRDFDQVLGLDLLSNLKPSDSIPEEVVKLVEQRNQLRQKRLFDEADKIRRDIEAKGYTIEDSAAGVRIQVKTDLSKTGK